MSRTDDVGDGPHRWRLSTLALLLAVIVGSGVAHVRMAPIDEPASGDSSGEAIDSDGDWLTDEIELAGWRTQSGDVHRTDPEVADTDGDGLSDRDEAGARTSRVEGAVVYEGRTDPTSADTDEDGLIDGLEVGDLRSANAGSALKAFVVSDPRAPDSDGDGIGDGDEYLLDMQPLAVDSDGDGMTDGEEIAFGSDPTFDNADEDSYSDAEEKARGSEPWSYDMSTRERLEAGEAGALWGSCHACAIDDGLRTEMLESTEYLVGHIASGVAFYGDVRDVLLAVRAGDFRAAALDATAALPSVGDASKASRLLITFASRSERARKAVLAVVERTPLPEAVKSKVRKAISKKSTKTPLVLAAGPKAYALYRVGPSLGITRDLSALEMDFAQATEAFRPAIVAEATNLTRGEALSMVRGCIVRAALADSGGSLRQQIDGLHVDSEYEQEIIDFGVAKLEQMGGRCPVVLD